MFVIYYMQIEVRLVGYKYFHENKNNTVFLLQGISRGIMLQRLYSL